jgi:hypothetical protein
MSMRLQAQNQPFVCDTVVVLAVTLSANETAYWGWRSLTPNSTRNSQPLLSGAQEAAADNVVPARIERCA